MWHSMQKLIAAARGANSRKVLAFARTILITAMIMKKTNKEKLKANHSIADHITADHEKEVERKQKEK